MRATILWVLIACAPPQYVQVQLDRAPDTTWSNSLRAALDRCARAQGLVGELRIEIVIDPDQRVGNITTDHGGFTRCLGTELAHVRFAPEHRDRALEIPFVARS
jgi:hypothetical protein